MSVHPTPAEGMLFACLKISVQSVPARLGLGLTPFLRWLVLQWMHAARHPATPPLAAPQQPQATPAPVHEDMLETPTRRDASPRAAVPMETRIARTRVYVSMESARTSAMTPAGPTQSAQSTTELHSVSAFKASFPAPLMQEHVSVTARAVGLMLTALVAQLARAVNAGYPAAARTTA